MKVVRNNNVMYFDVDNTLIKHEEPWADHPIDEFGEPLFDSLDVPGTKFCVYYSPITKHIKLLQRSKAKGMYIVVWSHGGTAWAEAVIKRLELEDYVDLIIHKVRDYTDDCPIEEWQFVNHFLHDGYGNTARKPKV